MSDLKLSATLRRSELGQGTNAKCCQVDHGFPESASHFAFRTQMSSPPIKRALASEQTQMADAFGTDRFIYSCCRWGLFT